MIAVALIPTDSWMFTVVVFSLLAGAGSLFSLMSSNTDDLERELVEAVKQTFVLIGMPIKEAAACMSRGTKLDESNLRKQLAREPGHHLSFIRMFTGLPFRFWMAFTPTFLYLLTKKHMLELAEDVGFRKSA